MTPTERTAQESTKAEDAATEECSEASTPVERMRSPFRLLLLGGVALLAISAVAIALVSNFGEKKRKEAKVPAYDVTYTVTGTTNVSVSVQKGGGVALPGGEISPSKLPWTKHIAMPADGTPPTMDILLGEKGGHAECTLIIRGRLASRSVAEGTFGRATCSAEAPTTAPSTAP
ncbi:hypothetical protein ACNPQM_30140 [Streptomyces sp. NPDC056231]|uniref:hypothetical protein n=1 Tax=Streptomyces sp. NPDC056231 TaxID=3345755 RepID=UPI003AAB3AE3